MGGRFRLSLRFAEGSRPIKGRNLAIAEWPTKSGPADYALFCGLTLVGVVEAKRKRKNVSAAIDQAERYSMGLVQQADFAFAGGPWADHKVPFVFSANGRSYLKQIETESGIWFRDTRRAANHRRALVDWPTPDGLTASAGNRSGRCHRSPQDLPFDFGFPLRDYQQHAIEAVERGLEAERRTMLLAMATGIGTGYMGDGTEARTVPIEAMRCNAARRPYFLGERSTLKQRDPIMPLDEENLVARVALRHSISDRRCSYYFAGAAVWRRKHGPIQSSKVWWHVAMVPGHDDGWRYVQ